MRPVIDSLLPIELAAMFGMAAAVAVCALILGVSLHARRLRARVETAERALGQAEALLDRLSRGQRGDAAQIQRLVDRIGQLELRSGSRAYEQAIDVAARGAEAERLVSHYGLNETEAGLVRLLHGRSSSTKPNPGRR